MSELILQKKARELCRHEGNAWSLKDFENGVPGVTMLNGDRRREETARVSEPSEIDAQTEFEVTAAGSLVTLATRRRNKMGMH